VCELAVWTFAENYFAEMHNPMFGSNANCELVIDKLAYMQADTIVCKRASNIIAREQRRKHTAQDERSAMAQERYVFSLALAFVAMLGSHVA